MVRSCKVVKQFRARLVNLLLKGSGTSGIEAATTFENAHDNGQTHHNTTLLGKYQFRSRALLSRPSSAEHPFPRAQFQPLWRAQPAKGP